MPDIFENSHDFNSDNDYFQCNIDNDAPELFTQFEIFELIKDLGFCKNLLNFGGHIKRIKICFFMKY